MTNQGVYSNPLVPAYLFPRGTDFDAYRIFERYNPASKLMEQFCLRTSRAVTSGCRTPTG